MNLHWGTAGGECFNNPPEGTRRRHRRWFDVALLIIFVAAGAAVVPLVRWHQLKSDQPTGKQHALNMRQEIQQRFASLIELADSATAPIAFVPASEVPTDFLGGKLLILDMQEVCTAEAFLRDSLACDHRDAKANLQSHATDEPGLASGGEPQQRLPRCENSELKLYIELTGSASGESTSLEAARNWTEWLLQPHVMVVRPGGMQAESTEAKTAAEEDTELCYEYLFFDISASKRVFGVRGTSARPTQQAMRQLAKDVRVQQQTELLKEPRLAARQRLTMLSRVTIPEGDLAVQATPVCSRADTVVLTDLVLQKCLAAVPIASAQQRQAAEEEKTEDTLVRIPALEELSDISPEQLQRGLGDDSVFGDFEQLAQHLQQFADARWYVLVQQRSYRKPTVSLDPRVGGQFETGEAIYDILVVDARSGVVAEHLVRTIENADWVSVSLGGYREQALKDQLEQDLQRQVAQDLRDVVESLAARGLTEQERREHLDGLLGGVRKDLAAYEWEHAQRTLEYAAIADPDDADMLVLRGLAHLGQNGATSALQDAQRALELEPGSALALSHTGGRPVS